MKKILLVAGSAALFSLNACKEVGPAIDFSPARAFDTSYMETPQTPEPKKVLVEEYTGVRCTNCPDAAQLLKAYDAAHPDKIVVVGLHAGAQTTPINEEHVKSKYNFSNDEVLSLINSYFGENPPKPAAAIDRVKFEQGYFSTNRAAWGSYIDQRGTAVAPVKITITSEYNDEKGEAVIKVKTSYTESVTKKQSLSVWIIEDNIVDAQDYPNFVDSAYVHNHVFRDFLTPSIGASILSDLLSKEPGQVYERTFIYKVNSSWNINNCRIVAFVHNNEQDDKSVVQVAEADLK